MRARASSAVDLPAPRPPVSPTKGTRALALIAAAEHVLAQPERGDVIQVAGALRRGLQLLRGAPRQLLALDALDRQRQPAAVRVDLQDLHAHVVARLDDLARVLHVVVGQLGDVHQALDAVEDLDEGAERDDLGHRALELVADPVGVDDALPRVLLGLLEAQRDALTIAVDVEHLDLDRVADVEDLGGVVDVRPRQLGDVDEPVDAVEVDERAEVDDVRDVALDHEAGLQPVEDLLALLLALLLEHGAAREDDVVARAVELDDLALDPRAEELVEVRHSADVDERRRQETAHAQVDDETALDPLDDRALDRLPRLRRRLDAPPRLLEAGALLGHDEAAVLVLLREDQRVDLLAQLDLVVRVDVLADRELVLGDDPLALVADVGEDLVVVDPHHAARDDVALLERREGGVVVRDDLPVDLEQQAVGSLDDPRIGGRAEGLRHVAEEGSADAPLGSLGGMPVRATKRGAQRTPLGGDVDVLVCGASFAGLAVARELRGSGARVLVVDRYEIGERQTSACAAPTRWLENLGLHDAIRQTFGRLVVPTPFGTSVLELPWTFSTFDYPALCELLWAQSDAEFETAKVNGRNGDVVHTDRGDLSAPLIVDALGWRRVLGSGYQPPDAPLSRGLEVHPHGRGEDLEIWVDRKYVPAGYGWSFPADGELRVGVGSFDPRFHVKDTTVLLADDLARDAVRYQGNWIPHKLRDAVEDGVFFVGDSAGHCLPLTAEGIRTAFYFGLALGRELREVVEGRQSIASALARYGDFSESHRWKFEAMLAAQRLVPRVPPRLLTRSIRAMQAKRFVAWSFNHSLDIAPPGFVTSGPPPRAARREAAPLAA